MSHLRSRKTEVLKRLFAIKKGWLHPVTGAMRRPARDEDDDGEEPDVTWQANYCWNCN